MPSAVPWTSTKRPAPVMTTFMSTSARESSAYGRSSIGTPSMMPTDTAATESVRGWVPIVPACTRRVQASCSAT